MELLEILASPAEFRLMIWETLMRAFAVYAVGFSAAVLFLYMLLLGREASRQSTRRRRR